MKFGKTKTIDIPLPIGQWPAEMDDAAVCKLVQGLHHRPEDFEEGDLMDRIYKYDRYRLEYVDLTLVDSEEWAYCDDLCQEYADLKTDLPPIVFDADLGSIIDGTHRVNAALKRGDTTILAYVAQPET